MPGISKEIVTYKETKISALHTCLWSQGNNRDSQINI